ncbi:hypothetical protein PYCC9005_003637 [Savitreella phatthalungensis]
MRTLSVPVLLSKTPSVRLCSACLAQKRFNSGVSNGEAKERQTPTAFRRPHYAGFYNLIMEQKSNPRGADGSGGVAEGTRIRIKLPADDAAAAAGATDAAAGGGIVFYSRLAGYPENRPDANKAKVYAGVTVPARPEEPLNCCQSGCIHCVWDIYREDVEDYQAKRKEARAALLAGGHVIPQELGGGGRAAGSQAGSVGRASQNEGARTSQRGVGEDKAGGMEEDEEDMIGQLSPQLQAFIQLEKSLKEKRLLSSRS